MRFYKIKPDEHYISVTSLLDQTSDKSFLSEWRNKIGHVEADAITKQAANQGTKLHTNIEKYLKGEETKPDMLFYNILPKIKLIKPLHLEHLLYSHTLKIAGRVDCIGEYDGQLSIIDFKSSRKEKRKDWITNYFLQCSYYSICYEEMTGERINNIVILISSPDNCQVFLEHRKNFLTECQNRYIMYKNKHIVVSDSDSIVDAIV